jgi:hypothetical protein
MAWIRYYLRARRHRHHHHHPLQAPPIEFDWNAETQIKLVLRGVVADHRRHYPGVVFTEDININNFSSKTPSSRQITMRA